MELMEKGGDEHATAMATAMSTRRRRRIFDTPAKRIAYRSVLLTWIALSAFGCGWQLHGRMDELWGRAHGSLYGSWGWEDCHWDWRDASCHFPAVLPATGECTS